MSLISKIFFTAASVVYPVIVFFCLVVFKVPLKVFSLFIVFMALLYLLLATGGKGSLREKARKNAKFLFSAALLLAAGLVCIATGKSLFIKLYPAVMNGAFLFTFASTLFMKPNICFRFACLSDRKLADSPMARSVERYCQKVVVRILHPERKRGPAHSFFGGRQKLVGLQRRNILRSDGSDFRR